MPDLIQSTATSRMVFMTDSTDHITGKAGLTLTITASKAGGAFASITPTVTERGNGWYALALTTAHTDTLGDLALRITGTGADPTDKLFNIVAAPTAATTAADVWASADRTLTSGLVVVVQPWQVGALSIIKGNSYLASDSTINALDVSKSSTATWPSDLLSAGDYVITFTCTPTPKTLLDVPAAVGFSTTTGSVVSATQVRLGDMSAVQTGGLTIPRGNGVNAYTYEVKASATRTGVSIVHTLERGTLSVG